MAKNVFNRISAVLADAFVSLINVLFNRNPKSDGHSAIPRESKSREFIDEEIISHTLPNPA